ncbi:MAG: hypothetical protein UX02_C0001G0111 [Candidatus Moranbacteria bacterium GW2011_GWC1_45_18]|nr:MAG: hypothetical protein UT79_C0002G0286 [Candidatus Moranbacteria bacterium GW2011_GWC2_40_12]KKT34125.1 MAG: hypothetical protein UW19_C0001G0020 [Candidatus Moranbacteria bacterium GW2011_GWF2_44_10]KKU00663.1 MAG: hypothetical protein UX02_C0001G0111 [Candidatus Moranbacteria bacterium GW2011_GWC1_45_18]OGI24529.1 MAG: hypothetical protein A2194_00205 [Candidatus Moranbacteria bacterium RIFOXYA1_FULL_44_8]OGI35147.1 MAG: hypothetical protein A2407_04445 [Candidatus Moranbacteria bacteri
MKIVLKIDDNNVVRIFLFKGKKEKESLEWKEENSLSRFLLANLDKLLRKNGAGLDKISEYKIISDVPENWTSARIAKVTFESLEIATLAK